MNFWQGKQVRLRGVEPSDATTFFEWNLDSEVARNLEFVWPPVSQAQVSSWVEEQSRKKLENDSFTWVIEDSSGRAVGSISTHSCNQRKRMQERPMMILIAGPYRSGTGDDPVRLVANVRAMEAYALPLYRAGHLPVLGEWFALPLVEMAGSKQVGDAPFNEIFHPMSERLLEKCDAVLRVGGASQGADLMVELARKQGLRVFNALEEVPGCQPKANSETAI